MRSAKPIPHLALVHNVRYSLEAIWAWETENSIFDKRPEPAPSSSPGRATQNSLS